MNAVMVQGDAVGTTLYYGKGAGAEPTASAVIADLVDIARLAAATAQDDGDFNRPEDQKADRFEPRHRGERRVARADEDLLRGDKTLAVASS